MIAGQLEILMTTNLARVVSDMGQIKGVIGNAMSHVEKVVGVAKYALGSLGLGLSAAALTAFAKSTIDAMDKLNDLSKATGITVEKLSGLKLAAQQAGGDLDSVAQAVSKLSQNMGKAPEKFAALGISAKDPLQALQQLADVFTRIEDPQMRAAVMAEALGKSWAGAAPLLAEGGRRLGEMVAEGERLSGITKRDAEEADKFNDQLVVLNATFERTKVRIVGDMLPGLNAIMKSMQEGAEEGGKFLAVMRGIQTLFTGNDLHKANVEFVQLTNAFLEQQNLIDRAKSAGAGAGLLNSLNVGLDKLKSRLDVIRRYREDIEATQRAQEKAAKPDVTAAQVANTEKLAAAFIGSTGKSKKAIDDLAAHKKRMEELDAKGWVAYIETTSREYEDGLRAQTKIDEDALKDRERALAEFNAEKKRMEELDAKGWVAYIEAMTQVYEDGLRAMAGLSASLVSDAAVKKLDEYLDPAKAKSFGDALSSAFGSAGSALGKLINSLEDYGQKMAEIEKMRATNAKINDPAIRAANEIKLAEQSANAQISAYGDMAAAAKGFFETGSSGYKALEAAEKVFRAFELASAIQTMLTKSGLLATFTGLFVASKATETAATVASVAPDVAASMAKGQAAALVGVANQAQGDPYSAWVRMAAMAAVMVGLGFAVSGSFSGGSGGQTAAQRQREQGTGTVLGDADAKSQSLLNSLKEIEKTDKLGLVYSHDMLEALRAIQSSMGALASLIFRTSGVTTGGDFGVQTGVLSRNTGDPLLGMLGINDSFLTRLDPILGGFVSALQGLWGKTTQEITDAGMLISGTVGQLMRGQGISQYANVTTNTSSWFGLVNDTSNSTLTAGVSDRLSQQFALIFGSIIDSIESAAKALDMWSPKFAEDLRNFVVEIDKISLQGLQGQDLQDALNSVFSTFADKVSLAFFGTGEMQDLAKAGEGFYETLIRVATGNEYVKQTFAALGLDLPLVGMAAVTARMELIDLAGGLEAFGKITQDYYSKYYSPAEQYANTGANLGAEFNRLGVAMPTDPAGLRALIESIGTATPEARALTMELMKLAGVFYDYSTAVLGLDGQMHTLDETTRQHRDLQEELDVLNGTKTAQFVERSQRMAEAIDATSLATLQAIFVEEDRQAGLANLAAQNEARWDLEQELLDLTQTESEALERQRSLRMTELSLREQELGMAPDSLQAIQRQINAQTDLNAARDAEAAALKTTSDLEGRLGVLRGDYTQQELDRAREWQAAADGYDKALLTQIYAMEDAKKAAEELAVAQATALDTEIELRGRLFELTHTEGEVLERNRQIRLDELRIMEITGKLVAGTLTSIQEQIYAQEDLNAAMEATTATFQDFFIGSAQWWDQQVRAAEEAARAAAKAAEDALKAAKAWSGHLTDWLNSNALSDLSPLTAQQQLLEAQRQYDLAKLGGDAGALTAAADMLLAADKAIEGFGGGYSALYAQIRADLAGLAESGPVATVGEAQIVTAVGELRQEVADAKVETARLLERLIEATRDGTEKVSGAVNTGTTKTASATEKAAAVNERK